MRERDHYILDADRNVVPVDLLTWAAFFEQVDNRRVDATEALEGTVVSIFLGLDHRFHGAGLPIVFETMAFGRDEAACNFVGVRRCSTWQEAGNQHRDAVNDLQAWDREGRR